MPSQLLSVPLLTCAPESFMAATNSSCGVTGLHNLCCLQKKFSFHISSIYWQKRIKAQLAKNKWRLLAVTALDIAFPLDGLGPDVQQADSSAVHLCG